MTTKILNQEAKEAIKDVLNNDSTTVTNTARLLYARMSESEQQAVMELVAEKISDRIGWAVNDAVSEIAGNIIAE